jgi:protein TonB
MEIDPATICARTGAGETELAQAKSGLTLPQRKALSLLAAPRAYAEFAAENHLDTVRLGRDLARLAELGLITLQLGTVSIVPPARSRPDAAAVRAAPAARPKVKAATPQTDVPLSPVVIGPAAPRSPMRMALLAGAIVIAMGGGWLALRGDSRATPRAEASVAQPPRTGLSDPPIVAAMPAVASAEAPASVTPSAPMSTVPAAPPRASIDRSTIARESASASAASARANDMRLAAAAPAPAPTASVPAPALIAPPPVAERPAASASPAPERLAEPAAALTFAATPVATAPATTSPPVQIASAAKPVVAPAPSVKATLQPIVREAPEFPKEAITEGVVSGTVKARVTLDGSGKVTGIEILEAQPRRVFDRAVRAALWRWQYEPGAPNRTADVEVAFARQ